MAECKVEKKVQCDPKSATKQESNNEYRKKVQKAIEAINLCYNYETGFHYIKQ